MNTGKFGAALALVAGLAGLMPGQAQAVAFINGGFETDNWNTGTGPVLDLDGVGGGITGWTAVDDPAPTTSGFFIQGWNNANTVGVGPTPFGSQWITLGEEGLGGNYVEQTVTGFTIGNSYVLTFSISSETELGAAILELSLQGTTTTTAPFAARPATTRSWDTWSTIDHAFVADAASIAFRFTDRSTAGNTALGLDNVSVAQAPAGTVAEPGSLALMLTAGALCAGIRRKRA